MWRSELGFIKRLFVALIFPALLLAHYSTPARSAEDFSPFDMTLEELLSMDVVSVTRSAGMTLFDAPASLYVINSDEIARSGYLQIPEILRLAPGLHVSRMDASTWAIASRGFNNRYNRMQLVQMDGRTLYSQLFGGVNWITQDYIMEDLDRIEVIRGPGASLWGANAVNGIISIMSKPASETQDLLFKTHTGTHERGIASLRYGDKFGPNTFYRFYLKQSEHSDFDTYTYNNAHFTTPYIHQFTPDKSDDLYSYVDGFRRKQAGFRVDWEGRGPDSFTLQADISNVVKGDQFGYATYTPVFGQFGTPPTGIGSQMVMESWNILGRWNRKYSENSDLQVQTYIDWNSEELRNNVNPFSDKRRIFDIDLQHNFRFGSNHKITWGGGYRRYSVSVADDNSTITFDPGNFNKDTLSGFLQDSFPFISREIEMTLGSKFERNDFTGNETQPSARLTWKPNDSNIVWAAVSKAVRTPVIGDNSVSMIVGGIGGVTIPAGAVAPGIPPVNLNNLWGPVTLLGSPDVAEEEVIAYELGYRVKVNPSLSLDTTLFEHHGHHMMRHKMDPLANALSLPVYRLSSTGVVRYKGLEFSGNWLTSNDLRLTAGYVFYDAKEMTSAGTREVGEETPPNQAQLIAHWDVFDKLEVNSALYYNDNVRQQDTRLPVVFKLDLGVTYRPSGDNLEIRLWGQNLLDPGYRDGGPDRYTSFGAAEVERGVYTEIVLRY